MALRRLLLVLGQLQEAAMVASVLLLPLPPTERSGPIRYGPAVRTTPFMVSGRRGGRDTSLTLQERSARES